MTDKVFIKELTTFASIGVYDWEHQIQQKLIFNIEMAWDFTQASQTDDVQFCLNYAEVAQKVLDFSRSRHFNLVEALASQLADKLQQEYKLSWLRIELHKPKAVAEASSVGVIVERGQCK